MVVGGAGGLPASWYDGHLSSTNYDPLTGTIPGHLVSIHSRGEQEFIRRLQRPQTVGGQYMYVGDTWIGLTDNDTNSVGLVFPGAHESGNATQEPDVNVRRTNGWVWTSGEPYDGSTFMNWNGGEPNDLPSEDAVVLPGHGFWNDFGSGIPDSGDTTNDRCYIVEWDIGSPVPVVATNIVVKQLDPVLPMVLPGPEGGAGTFGGYRAQDAGQFGDLRTSVQAIKSGGGTIITTNSGIKVINTYDPDLPGEANVGRFPQNEPVFGDTAGVTNEDYVVVYKGRIRIGAADAGRWTFGVRSNDGFALRIAGQTWVSAHGQGWIDHTDGSIITYEYATGNSDTRGVIDLVEGDYLIEFVVYQDYQSQYQELFAAKGEWHNEADTDTWRLVGYTGIGDYVVPGVMAPGWTVWHSNPNAHGGIGNTGTAWNVVYPNYVMPDSNRTSWVEINFLDPENGSEQELPGSVPFPFDTTNDENNVAMYMTAKLQILSNDTYHLGFRGDDGSWLQVVSQTWDSIVYNQTGNSYIEQDKIVLNQGTGNSRTIGAITLPSGEYTVNALWWETSGGASLDIFGGNGRIAQQALPVSYAALAADGARTENDPDGLPVVEENFDWGDAPDSYSTYATSTGASHSVVFGAPFLGQFVDVETDGQPTAAADGDDNNGIADEDGIIFTSAFVPGQQFTLTADTFHSTTDGVLNAWIDYDGDGAWGGLNEHVFQNVPVTAGGVTPLISTVPVSAVVGTTYARFRVSSQRGIGYKGYVPDGEVEDYAITIEDTPPPDQPKWIQRPDLSEQGMDVKATEPFILADDFKCTVTEPITSIVVWASWFNDETPYGSESNVEFTLSFHSDIPTNEFQRYSMPGEVLWSQRFTTGTFEVDVERDGLMEGWYNPERDEFRFPGDTICYRYTFPAVATNMFMQRGTTNEPVIYWLDVQAHPRGASPALFGWKTAETNWNDDAVWGEGREPFPGPWNELRYPEEHPRRGESIDLAFALYGGEEEEQQLDWGDAPDPLYPTLATSTGAWHVIGGPWLGDLSDAPDPELDGQQDPNALGDDNNDGNDDEDGAVIPTLTQGQTANIQVTVNSLSGLGGGLDVWIDYDGDGMWSPAENVFGASLPNGVHIISVTPPVGSVVGQTFARFRISTAGWHSPTGGASDGEVEDHEVFIEEEPGPMLDWGDAPDPQYPTLSTSTGAYHVIVAGLYLGWRVDAELDGQPHPQALGDDTNPPALPSDEDGVQVTAPIYSGGTANIDVIASGSAGGAGGTTYLNAWVDFNSNGWWDASEQIFTNLVLFAGTNSLMFNVPHVSAGRRFARFRYSTQRNLWATGGAPDGEVEDHELVIEEKEPDELDWGDAPDGPYPTLAASTGAYHIISGPFMGALVDAERNGQPTVQADGDDLNGIPDDEDGIVFPGPLVRGNLATVLVDMVASPVSAKINAWIDFNGDGKWGVGMGSAEHILLDTGVTMGMTNTLTFAVPWTARMGTAYARVRCNSAGNLAPSGGALDGEVEDYTVDICQPDPGAIRFTNTVWQVGDTVRVEWVSVTNIEYLLESSTNLLTVTNTGWTYEKTVTGPLNRALMPIGTNMLHKARYYRLTAPNTP